LLRIYLHDDSNTGHLLDPALELIASHSAQLDSPSVLALLPPLVPTSALRSFLLDALDPSRTNKGYGGVLSGNIMKEVCKARKHEVDLKLVSLKSRRVKVEDSRMCVSFSLLPCGTNV
jgi:hypothetical protein